MNRKRPVTEEDRWRVGASSYGRMTQKVGRTEPDQHSGSDLNHEEPREVRQTDGNLLLQSGQNILNDVRFLLWKERDEWLNDSEI